ncbi:hypothetical protein L6164_002939 [Bauhinia variegata]|uniref:Uncharacterized protein n=1 Tax=Bauhinia variegata TaxID=167791 RepID=A0ACB9Q191_BAUVA|nr:hypothetical protein L6164_002939 [Bauhinia variegata]
MSLKTKLSTTTKGSEFVQVYMQKLKNTADEIGLVSSPVDELDLVIYVLNGLGSEFKEINQTWKSSRKPYFLPRTQTSSS